MNAKVICGSCKVEPKVVTYGDGGREAICLVCGQKDEPESALRTASEQFEYQAARALQKGFTASARGKKAVLFEAKRLPRRSFRWHLASSD